MKKLLALVSAVGLVAMMSGCGLNDPVSAPTISIDAIGSIAIAASNVSKTVTGEIKADTAIESISAVVTTSAGATVRPAQIEVTTPAPNGATSQNLTSSNGIVLLVKPAALAGDYKLKITVMAGVEGSGTFNFTLTGNPGTPITVGTVEIGSLDNPSKGSSIDLDDGTVMLAAAAKAAGSGVDIVCTYSSDLSAFRIFSPEYAKTASGITAFANWVSPNDTKFKKVTAVTFASVTTVEAIAALYSSTTGTELTNSNAAVGDVFVVDTDEGFALIEITSFTSTTTGTANIKYGN